MEIDDERMKKFLDNIEERIKWSTENGCKLLDCKTIDSNIELRRENIKLRNENKYLKDKLEIQGNLQTELEKKDKIIFETKKYLENMTKSSIRDRDGYYLGNWYVLEPYEFKNIIDILKGKKKDE